MAENRKFVLVQRALIYLIIPGLVGTMLILKTFFFPGCLAFDSSDEANSAFVNLFAAREIWAAGEIPFINLFQNFGSPILGDSLTFPFSIQSLFYIFLDAPVAMTVSRFVIDSQSWM